MMRSHLMKPACGVKSSGGWIKSWGVSTTFFFDMRFKCSAVTPHAQDAPTTTDASLPLQTHIHDVTLALYFLAA